MTQCNQERFEFEAHFSRGVVARFDGGTMTSDGGALLLRQTDQRLNLLPRLAACFEDQRSAWLISHSVRELVSQRVYGLALGYEDLNDHDQLREDPLLAVLSGKRRGGEEALAGKSTLNRLELSTETPSRYEKIHCRQEAIDALWTAVFLEAHSAPPERIVLDLDTTGLRLAGHQEGRFFHAYYDEYCYLPLYIFSGEHLLCARLRTADQDAAAGSKEEVERIVGQIRQAWPEVEIILRADSGFCREELRKWSGLCAAARLTAARIAGHGVGTGTSHPHPPAALEDRRADPDYGAQGVVVAGLQLPSAAAVCASLGGVALLSRSVSETTAEQDRPRRIGGRSLLKTLSRACGSVREAPSRPRKGHATRRSGQTRPQNAAKIALPTHQYLVTQTV